MKLGNFILHERTNIWGRDFIYMEENGFAVGRVYIYNDDENVAYIEGVDVSESKRKNGIGKSLINMLIRKCEKLGVKKCMLWCYTDGWVYSWYQRMGFTYFSEHQDEVGAVWMVKNLKK